MRYLGSKAKIAKPLLEIILKDRKPGQTYVEPFAGGCNILDKAENPRIGSDPSPYLYALIIALRDGWVPPKDVPEELYNRVRQYYYDKRDKKHTEEKFEDALVGYIGINLSYGGKMFGGYARDKQGEDGKSKQNYSLEAYNNVTKQAPLLKGIKFYNKSYEDLTDLIPANSIIYCDPPYGKATGYGQKFDSVKFWNWCRKMTHDGHKVFVSEYAAPSDFKVVWKKSMRVRVSNVNKESTERVEKLFVPSTQIKESRIFNWQQFNDI